MAVNAYGADFWIGRVLLSKDKREHWRHVVITEMRNGRAKCHTLLYRDESGKMKMNKRGAWNSFKTLATRWTTCQNAECGFCNPQPDQEQPQ